MRRGPKETPERIALSLAPRTTAEIAYLAGFIDGEGCIAVYEHKVCRSAYKQVKFSMQATNTDRRPLEWIMERFGGAITKRGGVRVATHREMFYWYALNARAEAVMRLIRPYVQIKGPQIDLALQFRETYYRVRFEPEIRERRVVLLSEIKALKRRA